MYIPEGGIAFFDSGIGGLTTLCECAKRIFGENFYYYGDNTHAPYGNLSYEIIRNYVFNAFDNIACFRPKAAVVACNTATAVCVEDLRKRYSFPIVGAEPAIFAAAKNGGLVYVLSTKATFESIRFRQLCRRVETFYPNCTLVPYACEGLAGEIESRLLDTEYDFTGSLPKGDPDSVVLGCTHYIFIKKQIEQFYACSCYDGNAGMAQRLRSFLPSDFSENGTQNSPSIFFLGNAKNTNQTIYEQMFAKAR
ncbi:MAG: glutamate racemase [Clostridia bacterium]|nr:glutamate racemase [Clostridia bacterium]